MLISPFLLGATDSEEVHSNSEVNHVLVTSSNASEISKKYGYFGESTMPTITRGNESSAKMRMHFTTKTTKKIQLRLYYVYGTYAKFNRNSTGCNYYLITESAFASRRLNTGVLLRPSLGSAFEDHGITTDYRYDIFTATFALGFYVDEHVGSYKGVFYYIYVATTYNSGKHYHLKISTSLDSAYKLRNTDFNKNEYHKTVTFGGKEWKNEINGVYGGSFVDFRDFIHEDRGEAKTNFINVPLKMQLTQFGKSDNIDLPTTSKSKLRLFIYEGYELFALGESIKGYDGEYGYEIPLKTSFDGKYVTLVPKDTLFLSPDGRRVYTYETLPQNNKEYCVPVNGKIPLPAIPNKTPKTIKFQIELLNVGVLGLVDITAKFSYTINSNYFGSHKNSNYYVEEEL